MAEKMGQTVRLPPRMVEIIEEMSRKYGESKTSIMEKAITIGLLHLRDLYEPHYSTNTY